MNLTGTFSNNTIGCASDHGFNILKRKNLITKKYMYDKLRYYTQQY